MTANFWIPYAATPASSGGGQTGLFVVPSGALTTMPAFVNTSAVQVLAQASNINVNGNGIYTASSPATLMFAAADRSNNLHVYGVNLANATNSMTAPTATQIGNLSLPITGGAAIGTVICSDITGGETSSLSASSNALDPTTLFVVLHIAGSTGCNTTGDTWEVVHFGDSTTTAPVAVTALTTSSAAPPYFEPLYKPAGPLAGIVALDPGSGKLQLFADDTFSSPTTLVASVSAASNLYDTGSTGLRMALFVNTTATGGQHAIYEIPYSHSGGAATAIYTPQGTIGTTAVADNGNVYFTDTSAGGSGTFTPGAVTGTGKGYLGPQKVNDLTATGTATVTATTLTVNQTSTNTNPGGVQQISETDVFTGTLSSGTFTATSGTYEYTACTDVSGSICSGGSEGSLNSPAAFDTVSGTVSVSTGTLTVQRTDPGSHVKTNETLSFAAGSGGGSGTQYLLEQLPLSGGSATTILSASTAFTPLGSDGSVVVLEATSGSTTTLYKTPVNAASPASSATAINNAVFTGTLTSANTFMQPTTAADPSTSLIYVTAVSTGTYTSEVLDTAGNIKQTSAANSAFLNGGATYTSGLVLQVQGISSTGYVGGTFFSVSPGSLTGGGLGGTVLKSGGAPYAVPTGATVSTVGLSNTIGAGVEVASGGVSQGLAYDLSQGLIVPISLANTNVTLE